MLGERPQPVVGAAKIGAGASGVVVLVLIAGCAHPPAPGQSGRAVATEGAPEGDERKKVLVGPEALKHGDEALAAWLRYGSARLEAYQKTPPPPENRSADDYLLELAGREAQSQFWQKARERGAPAYEALDRQVEIWQAGFLPELVVSIHAHPGWTIPGGTIKALRLPEFARRFPGTYVNKLVVVVVGASGAKFPAVPGADFPDSETFPKGPENCGYAREERAAAWRRWEALAPRLSGVPIAAPDALTLAAALERVKQDPTYLKRGVTWVSWRVGTLAFLDGFCAVDAKDWPRAVAMLTRAVELMPLENQPRLELAMALNMVKRYDESLAQDRAVIEHTNDGCLVATALRHEGYTYVDMGMLESARLAYEKSLEIEPASAIAARELKVIAQGLAARRAAPKAAGEFVPPAMGSVQVTKCVRSPAK